MHLAVSHPQVLLREIVFLLHVTLNIIASYVGNSCVDMPCCKESLFVAGPAFGLCEGSAVGITFGPEASSRATLNRAIVERGIHSYQ